MTVQGNLRLVEAVVPAADVSKCSQKSAVFPATVRHGLPNPVPNLPARRTLGVLSAYFGRTRASAYPLEVVPRDSTDMAGDAGHPYPKRAHFCASAANTMALTRTDLLTFPELVLRERVGSKYALFARV
jgi:hypothetical protein